MSKKARKDRPAPEPVPAVTATLPMAPPTVVEPAWIDSPDPRRRRWGKILLVVVWLYVAALWLLALDQWFNWGIFGP